MTKPRELAIVVNVPVTARLVLLLPDGSHRLATDIDLQTMGYHHTSDMYDRTTRLLDAVFGLGSEDDDSRSTLRYFIEHITHYDHALEEDTIEDMKKLIGRGSKKAEGEAE